MDNNKLEWGNKESTFFPNNIVRKGDGFYISFLPESKLNHAETALVVKEPKEFFILYGNHLKEYEELIPLGLDACFEYYNQNSSLHCG